MMTTLTAPVPFGQPIDISPQTPNLIGTLHAATYAAIQFESVPPVENPADAVEDLIAWLNGDTLDWEAVERGDSWTD